MALFVATARWFTSISHEYPPVISITINHCSRMRSCEWQVGVDFAALSSKDELACDCMCYVELAMDLKE